MHSSPRDEVIDLRGGAVPGPPKSQRVYFDPMIDYDPPAIVASWARHFLRENNVLVTKTLKCRAHAGSADSKEKCVE